MKYRVKMETSSKQNHTTNQQAKETPGKKIVYVFSLMNIFSNNIITSKETLFFHYFTSLHKRK